jgi:hypothetical protein
LEALLDFETTVRMAIYRHIVDTTAAPTLDQTARLVGASPVEVREAYRRLCDKRVLVLQPDGETILMAPPFAGNETQHLVRVEGREYFANRAWDAFGVVAALRSQGEVMSRCEQTLQPLSISVGKEGPDQAGCVIHFAVPAAQWWDDIVHT